MKTLLILLALAAFACGEDANKTYSDSQLDFKAKYGAPFTANTKVIDGQVSRNFIAVDPPVSRYQSKEVYVQDYKYGQWKKVETNWQTNSFSIKGGGCYGKKYKVIAKGY